jgi:murein DD-endopeptidase MepM/ murein hydrolase activator NlpD
VTNDLTVAGGTSHAAAPASVAQPGGDAERQRVKQMAQEFEALIMTQMLRSMRQSMLSDEDEKEGLGAETMTDTVDVELGRALSQAGGFGLAAVLSKALDQRSGGGPSQVSPGQPAALGAPALLGPIMASPTVTANPAVTGSPAVPGNNQADLDLPNGPLSSGFGWRRDPFSGVPQFHRGIDVAQAYGQDVRAAATGRVAFAGTQGAYGTTIVIEHSGNRQTRYAHLSEASVRPGDLVEAGEVIGKSGDSGRSTGPHLHFEVVEAGQVVDPLSAP